MNALNGSGPTEARADVNAVIDPTTTAVCGDVTSPLQEIDFELRGDFIALDALAEKLHDSRRHFVDALPTSRQTA